MKSIRHLAIIQVQDEYETPKNLLVDAIHKYKIFPKLDVSATPENSKCPDFFTKEQNALELSWTRDFFMNPPYSKVEKFMKKAYYQHLENNVNALILVYAKTDTKWWHKFVENKAEIHFIEGRIKFLKNGFVTKNSAPYGSVWIIYRTFRNLLTKNI